MKALNTASETIHADLFDYDIIDQDRERVGSVHCLWNDPQSGELEFLGVKTAWLFGSNHVVPAADAQFDEATHTIQVPYLLDLIKDAPTVDADDEVSEEVEAEIYRYYGRSRRSGTSLAAADTTRTAVAGGLETAATRVAADDAPIEVTLSEEQVKIGKRTVEAGSVRLRKVVRTEIVNQPVEVRREEVVVERISADDVRAGSVASDFSEKIIDVPLTREEVVVAKEAHITGAVRLAKTSAAETETVSETVRKEDVEITRDGELEVAGHDAGRN